MKPWIAALVALVAQPTICAAAEKFEIEAMDNDEIIVIDGEVYRAQTYCMGWERGETVIFAEGTPGACASAKLVNLSRGEVCAVWCE